MNETSDAELEAARRLLRQAEEDQSFDRARRKTKTERILALREDITRLRARGATWEHVSEILRPVIVAGPDTIRLAIGGGPKPNGKKKRKPKAQPKLQRAAHREPRRAIAEKKKETVTEPPADLTPEPVRKSKFLKMEGSLT